MRTSKRQILGLIVVVEITSLEVGGRGRRKRKFGEGVMKRMVHRSEQIAARGRPTETKRPGSERPYQRFENQQYKWLSQIARRIEDDPVPRPVGADKL